MIILDLSIKSNCSLSKMAHDFNGEVLSFSVSQFSKGMNSIIAFVTLKEKNQETLMKSWKKRYGDFSYLNWDKIGEKSILFNGLKEGHGIVKTLIEYKGALITPTIAGDGYERFLILIKNKKDIDYIIKDISRNNNAYNYGYFSWPKEINLEELSLKLGVSQPTIIYHIRNAINKILSNILSDS